MDGTILNANLDFYHSKTDLLSPDFKCFWILNSWFSTPHYILYWLIQVFNLLSSICDLFSALDSISFENQSLNSSWESNNVGMTKWSNDHSSAIEFWIGVPDRRSRFRHLNSRSIFQRWLDDDLMAWASSRTMYCHLIRLKYLKSVTTSWNRDKNYRILDQMKKINSTNTFSVA